MAIKQESVKLSISDDCNGHDGDVEIKNNDNKQLLDEVEHDIMNYQNRGLCYRLRQIIQTRGFDNS